MHGGEQKSLVMMVYRENATCLENTSPITVKSINSAMAKRSVFGLILNDSATLFVAGSRTFLKLEATGERSGLP